MGWSLNLVRVKPGQDVRKTIEAGIAGWIVMTDEGPMIGPNPTEEDAVRSDETDRWMRRVIELLQGMNPRFTVDVEVYEDASEQSDPPGEPHLKWIELIDRSGPCDFVIFANALNICPGRVGGAPPGSEFETMWNYCQMLAEKAECVAYDTDEDLIIDLSLELDEARETYGWI